MNRLHLSPEQCRMARAGLELSRAKLSAISGVAAATISDFERGNRCTYARTVHDLRAALERAGAVFLDNSVSVEGGIDHA